MKETTVQVMNEYHGQKMLSDEDLDKMSLGELVREYGHWCESFGYADAACRVPYPPERAVVDRFQAAEQRDRLEGAIQHHRGRELNQQLANARESTENIFGAIVSGVISKPSRAF